MIDLDAAIKTALLAKNQVALVAYRALKTKAAVKLSEASRDDDAREHWVDIFGPAFDDAPAGARPDTSLPGAAPWRAPPPPLVPSSESSAPS